MNRIQTSKGFTLIELMVTIAIVAILLTIAAPSFNEFRERVRLRGNAETLVNAISTARFESIKRNQPVSVSVARDGVNKSWCAGLSVGTAGCDCMEKDTADASFCPLGTYPQIDTSSSVSAADQLAALEGGSIMFANPNYDGDGIFSFDPKLGVLTNAADVGSVTMQSGILPDYKIQVNLALTGRTNVCVPSGANPIGWYKGC